ncbi:hypothetical protein SRHO_G00164740 [Serrasalmus rhombeus]
MRGDLRVIRFLNIAGQTKWTRGAPLTAPDLRICPPAAPARFFALFLLALSHRVQLRTVSMALRLRRWACSNA